MNQRTALSLAAALTAFVLVIVGGLTAFVARPPDPAPTAAPPEVIAATPLPALDPSVEALIREREAAYRAALEEANARLEAANGQIASANSRLAQAVANQQARADRLAQSQTPAAPPAPAAQAVPVSREQAIQVAVAYLGGGQVVEAGLERERGTQVYELKFSDGNKVYVDAATGQVVYARIEGDDHAGEHRAGDGD